MLQDSPLSITASIAGILTFIYAVLAGAFSYLYLLETFRNSEVDIERFYEAFGACALETSLVEQSIAESKKWLQAQQQRSVNDPGAGGFFLDPKPIERLYDHVRTVEIELQIQAAKVVKPVQTYNLVERMTGRGRWMSRSRELEASLSKREALTARLLVIQMSLFLAKLQSQSNFIEELDEKLMLKGKELEIIQEQLKQYRGHEFDPELEKQFAD